MKKNSTIKIGQDIKISFEVLFKKPDYHFLFHISEYKAHSDNFKKQLGIIAKEFKGFRFTGKRAAEIATVFDGFRSDYLYKDQELFRISVRNGIIGIKFTIKGQAKKNLKESLEKLKFHGIHYSIK